MPTGKRSLLFPDMKSPRTPDNEEPAEERAHDFRPVDKGFTKGDGAGRG